ncbi:MAG: SDR family NAD(P)-dependent oxidoreductase [Chloroflexota bacterium]
MKFADKVAVVTGGANGIGRATVTLLASEGAKIAIADVDRAGMDGLVAELTGEGREVFAQYCDLSKPESVREMVEATVARFGRLDVLVNCAGGSGMTAYYATEEGKNQKWAEEIPEAEWDATLALNLTAVFLCCKYAIPHMKKQGGGKIVNFSSIGAEIGRADSSFAYAAYAAAKAGVGGLTRHLATELGPFNINVNAVCPGGVLTERMVVRFRTDWAQNNEQVVLRSTPLRRRARPDEIAAAVAYLASEEASFITGVTLDINGGRYMH